MSLALYGHPFSSYTQKALVSLYENQTPFEFRCIAPEFPEHSADWAARWPFKKFPVLVANGKTVAESSIIIEYLQQHHAGPVRLIPTDFDAALEVRFMDRLFDLHVMAPMQTAVFGSLSGDQNKRKDGMAHAQQKLAIAYQWLEERLAGRAWAAGGDFSMADCAAAPSLFYADWTVPIPDACPTLKAYRARLLARPSFARAVDEGRPYRHFFPLGAPDRD